MALEVGKAYVDLVPKLSDDFADSVSKQLKPAFSKVGDSIADLGADLTKKVSLPIVAGFTAAIFSADKLQGSLREVVSLTGATGAEGDRIFSELAGGVAKLSSELGVAQTTLTQGLYQALSAGVPRDNVFDFMQVAAKAAIAGVTDTDTAVNGLTTIINAFGLEASDAGKVADSMFATVKGGKTTFAELSASIFNVAPLANAAGISFQTVNAALQNLTLQGVPTAQATTQIRAALQGLLKPSAELDAIYKKAGFKDAAEALRKDFGGALNIVRDATGGNIGELTKLLGSVEAVGAVLGLTGDQAEGFAKALEDQAKAAGATDAAFSEIDKGRNLERLKIELQNLAISVGTVLLPIVQDIADAIVPWLQRFAELSPTVQKIIVGVLGLVAALGPFLVIFGNVVKFIGLAQKAFIALNAAMALNPFVIIAVAVAALAIALVVLYKKNEAFREAVQKAFGWLAENVPPILEKIRDIALKVFGAIADAIPPIFDAIKTVVATVGKIIGEVAGVIANVLDAIRGPVEAFIGPFLAFWRDSWEPIAGIVEAAFGIIKGVFDGFVRIVKGFVDVIAGLLTGDWSRVWDGLVGIVGGSLDQVKAVVGGALKIIPNLIEVGLNSLEATWSSIWGGLSAVVEGTWSTIVGVVEKGLGVLKALFLNFTIAGQIIKHWDDIKAATSAAWDAITGTVSTAWDAIQEAISIGIRATLFIVTGGMSEVIRLVIGHWDQITAATAAAWDAVAGVVSSAFEAITGAVSAGISTIAGVISSAWSAVTAAFEAALNGIKTVVETYFNLYRTVIETAIGAIRTVIETALGAVRAVWEAWTGAIRYATDVLFGYLKTFVEAEINGIRNIIETVLGAISAVWEAWSAGVRAIASTLFGWLKSFVTTELNGLRNIFEAVTSAISLVWSTAFDLIRAATETAFAVITAVVSAGLGLITSVISAGMATVTAVIEQAWGIIRGTFEAGVNAVNAAAMLMAWIIGQAFGIVTEVINNATGVIREAGGWIVAAFEAIHGAVGTAIDWAITKLTELLNWLKNNVDKLLGPLDEIFGALGKAGGAVGGLVKKIPGLASGGVKPASAWSWVGENGPELQGPTGVPTRVLSNELSMGLLGDAMAKASAASSGGTSEPTLVAPITFTGPISVRSEADITELSRRLAREILRQQRAQGKQTIRP